MTTSVASSRPIGVMAQRILTDDAAAPAFTHCSQRFAATPSDGSAPHPLLGEVRAYLLRKSALLHGNVSTQSHCPVIEAYLFDQELFGRSALSFQRLFAGALRAGIVLSKRDGGKLAYHESPHELRQKFLADVQPFQWSPPQPLDAHRIRGQAPSELLADLRTEFTRNADGLLQSIAAYIGELVQKRFLGYQEVVAPGICWYGYFLRGREDIVQSSKQWTEREPGYETTKRRQQIQSVTFEEYHEHHVYQAKIQPVDAYKSLLPSRVGLWLLSLPRWMRRHLRITDGQIFHESVLRRDLCVENRVVQTIVERRVNYSPAVTLGPCVLVGWNGRDLMRESAMKLQGPARVNTDVIDERAADFLLEDE